MTMIDLVFNIRGELPLPADHAYGLYAAVCGVLPAVHDDEAMGIHPIRGVSIGDRMMALTERSRLTLRVAADRIAEFLPLAGKRLDVAGTSLRIGVPAVHTLSPAPALRSRLTTIKGFLEPEPFAAAVRRQLSELGVSPSVELHLERRRTLRIKDKEVVGFGLLLQGLSAEESLNVLEKGVGGRRKLGCGLFLVAREGR